MDSWVAILFDVILIDFVVFLCRSDDIYVLMFSAWVLQMSINLFYSFWNIRPCFLNGLLELVSFFRVMFWMQIQL